jgi:hypothetical protein
MFNRLFPSPARQSRPNASCRPILEALEDRVTPTAVITDMTQLAQQLNPTPPAQPTHLYLNFDGFQGQYEGENHTVQPFSGGPSDIQDILFRTSEEFAPFNVEVSRLDGANNYDAGNGSTTLFIGGDQQNLDWKIPGPYAHSGLYGLDSSTQFHKDLDGGVDHAPHSNPFNLAWVDPTSKVDAQGNFITDPTQWTNTWDNATITERIAHEAGHTFGLAHVDSLTIGEMMSYTAENTRFDNIPFQITTLDNNGNSVNPNYYGLQPVWDGSTITTQNSFTFLQAELGPRPDNGMAHVAHQGSVDPSAYVTPTGLDSFSPVQGVITRPGDYDVYSYTAGDGQNLVSVNATAADGATVLDPELLIYDSQGHQVLSQNMDAGQTYSIVVGAVDGVSTGSYQLNVLHIPNVPPQVGPVGPEDPVTAPGSGVGDPAATGPGPDLGQLTMVTNPSIDPGLYIDQSAVQVAASVTTPSSILQGTSVTVSQQQSPVITQTSFLPYTDVLGLQQSSGLSSTSYSPSTMLAPSLSASMALPSLSVAQMGGYFSW